MRFFDDFDWTEAVSAIKTPDEIKKGLKCHGGKDVRCGECCYKIASCRLETAQDALALIQQLEAELRDSKENHQYTIDIAEKQKEQIQKMKNVVVRLSNERDAAVSELVGTCQVCLWEETEKCTSCHFNADAWNTHESNWQWRGIKKA